MGKVTNVEFKVVGVTFKNPSGESRQNLISGMTNSSPVVLTREPQNQYDVNAIVVSTVTGQIGYVAKQYAQIMAPMMDTGRKFIARVKEVDQYQGTWYCKIIVDEV